MAPAVMRTCSHPSPASKWPARQTTTLPPSPWSSWQPPAHRSLLRRSHPATCVAPTCALAGLNDPSWPLTMAELEVHLVPLRRRHLRAVLRIEAQVYPRPWSLPLFMSELNLRGSRHYVAARIGGMVV